jgi:hypothetical protein
MDPLATGWMRLELSKNESVLPSMQALHWSSPFEPNSHFGLSLSIDSAPESPPQALQLDSTQKIGDLDEETSDPESGFEQAHDWSPDNGEQSDDFLPAPTVQEDEGPCLSPSAEQVCRLSFTLVNLFYPHEKLKSLPAAEPVE